MHHPPRQSPFPSRQPSDSGVVPIIDYDACRARAVQLRRDAIAQCCAAFVQWWRGVWTRRALRSLPIRDQGDSSCRC